MKISFSTLACPSWKLDAVLEIARNEKFDGVELRFIENDDRLWSRAEFTGSGLRETIRKLNDSNLEIPCLDTSCFFHDREQATRQAAIEQGKRMAELAARLGAPGIRVFGDSVQPGATREMTCRWVAESIDEVNQEAKALGVEVWLESHGDFASASETVRILMLAGESNLGVVWDPANAFAEGGEDPETGMQILGSRIRHVHVKDAKRPSVDNGNPRRVWDPVLMGEGDFPAIRLLSTLSGHGYERYVSFEWEKRWHPAIPEPEIALRHFANWVRRALAV
ncbi:MAG TPA: sugar phosphate isomerase/epimerase family protein [Terriglobia bacterium]|nr:sugar phosphate isomerase/epimerase family protein [Terriglobia bacterium]